MPFNRIPRVLSCSCERFAISLGDELWPVSDLAFDRATIGNSERTSFPGWLRAGIIAVMTKEIAGMLALETPTR
jgi:hypothetical protein